MGQKRTFLGEKTPEQGHGKVKQPGVILRTTISLIWQNQEIGLLWAEEGTCQALRMEK